MARLATLLAVAVAFGASPAACRRAPREAGSPPEAATPETAPQAALTDADWRAACEGDRSGRIERFRALALRDAESWKDRGASGTLERWQPRGRDGRTSAGIVAPPDRAAVLDVVRRWIKTCGPDEVVSLTTDLVRFQTVAAVASPPENPEFLAMAAFL